MIRSPLIAIFALLVATSAAAAPKVRSAQRPIKRLTVRTIAMPADTNPAGDIFGGWLMAQMDMAAGSVAHQFSRGRTATVAVDKMEFRKPVKVGDEVSLQASLVKVGRTSMRVRVEAFRRARETDHVEQVTAADFTVVALSRWGNPRPAQPGSLIRRVAHAIRRLPKRLRRRPQQKTASCIDCGEVLLRKTAQPNDANPAGDVSAGWLLSQMDLAAGNAATRIAQGRTATVAADKMAFTAPVKVGDEVTMVAKVERRGRTSVGLKIEAWSRPRHADHQVKVTEGHFTFVAIGKDGKSKPLPPAAQGQ